MVRVTHLSAFIILIFLFGNHPDMMRLAKNNKVRFSDDKDLSDAECHRLLQKYMPEHIKETKITEKLFIK